MKKISRFQKILSICVVSVAIFLPLLLWAVWISMSNESKFEILFSLSNPAYQIASETHKSAEQLTDWQSFEEWIQSNVKCENDFLRDVQDKDYIELVKSMGVVGDQFEFNEPTDANWQLPNPVSVFGFQTSNLHFEFSSGSYFEVEVNASVAQVAKAIGARNVPLYMYNQISADAVIFKSQPVIENGYPDLIFVRSSDNKKTSWIGCRSFDT